MDPSSFNTLYENSFTRLLSQDSFQHSDDDLTTFDLERITIPSTSQSAAPSTSQSATPSISQSSTPLISQLSTPSTSQSPTPSTSQSTTPLETELPRKRQRISGVWTYFTLSEDGRDAKCLVCLENNR